MSIYKLKGRFQAVLRPGVGRIAAWGIAANQVTVAAAIVSAVVAAVVWAVTPGQPWVYLLLPGWMLLRMALNAVDGMLAREFAQQSRLGAYLNELCDVIADAALYLALLSVAGVSVHLVWTFVALSALTEYAGVLGLMVGAQRRYDGPMGKSDRAFVIGLLGLLLAGGWIGASAVNAVVAAAAFLCVVTVIRRVRAGLRGGATT
ncbi:CDP-alcohol phosphatidyltransferase family protein [Lysobacter sp. H23M47]|uniref:CDP-alcohol phosphatidyltransferase family protein n=1 Tax=Lysobacter sp. H23M47 TaxID=2781024 RepID=UPI0018802A1A|nr:CDP-alcohol phosphatidyltransferase family protein [Lysobacter sp. H23M47]QOW24892.1 CDP-alcohol phosphatidyltransferase family protein [Lysobacter sp. H23M47]